MFQYTVTVHIMTYKMKNKRENHNQVFTQYIQTIYIFTTASLLASRLDPPIHPLKTAFINAQSMDGFETMDKPVEPG